MGWISSLAWLRYGCLYAAPNRSAQTVRQRNQVSIGASLMIFIFAHALFGVIFVSVNQHVLDGELAKRLLTYTIVGSTHDQARKPTMAQCRYAAVLASSFVVLLY